MAVAYLQTMQTQERLKEQYMQKPKKCNTNLFIAYPTSRRKMVWDVFIIFLVLYNSVILPLDVAFQVQQNR